MCKKCYSTFLFLVLVIISITVMVQAQDTSACPATDALELVIGEQGRVLPGTANRVRSAPSTSGEVLFQIEAGTVFEVIGQAECSDGYRWWQIRYEGQEGWTVEGNDSEYFLEVVPLESEPVSTQPAVTDECEMQARLVVGGLGKITSSTPSRVRSIPSTSGEQSGQIQPLDTFNVLEGPVCADGINWWRVSVGSLDGWTAEGVDGEYLIEPVTLEAEPVTDECEMQARLVVGGLGKITSSTPSRVRSIPSTSGVQSGQIQPLDTFNVLEGPVCADGINWWRVSVGSLDGWTAEGVDGEYLIEPVEILPTPTPEYIGLPEATEISWNSDGTLIAVGTQHEGIFIYDTSDWSQPPTQIFAGADVHSLTFVPDNPQQIAVSLMAGNNECGERDSESKSGVFVYDLSTDEIPVMIRDFTGSCGVDLVSQLQFTEDGTILITNSSGQFVAYTMPDGEFDLHIAPADLAGEGFPMFDQIAISGDGSQLLMLQISMRTTFVFKADYSDGQLIEFEDEWIEFVVTAVALSTDGNKIVIGDEAGNLRTYVRPEDADSYSEYNSFIRGDRSTTSNRINAIAIDPSGAIITAESDPRAVVRVFEPQSLSQVKTYLGGTSTSAALDLALNPDGSLLAVLIDDTVHILDTSDYSQIAELVLQRN